MKARCTEEEMRRENGSKGGKNESVDPRYDIVLLRSARAH